MSYSDPSKCTFEVLTLVWVLTSSFSIALKSIFCGSTTVNVVPTLYFEVNDIVPPKSSTNFFVITRPSPVPSTSL